MQERRLQHYNHDQIIETNFNILDITKLIKKTDNRLMKHWKDIHNIIEINTKCVIINSGLNISVNFICQE